MQERKYHTKEAVLTRGQKVIGIPLKEIDRTGRLVTGKGAVGTVLEESWFGYTVNSEAAPDFEEAGVELKATPYVRGKKGIRAKERLVCNIINYMEEYKCCCFEESSFWHKCNTMLLMSYEYKKGESKGDITIDKATLFSFPEEDLMIIENDWKNIIDKIRAGKAHEISESDTLYLAACTKGATAATSLRDQPFSKTKAKQRAYSLKSSYMTSILNDYIFGNKQDEHIITDPKILRESSFEDYLYEKIRPYIGRSQASLQEEFDLSGKAKNMNELILARILGLKGNLKDTAEFKKAGIVPKTIRVQKNGHIRESMSFPTFKFKEIIEKEWEDSAEYDLLSQSKFLFIIFQQQENGEYVLSNLRFWNMPEDDLAEVEYVWKSTVDVIKEGVKIEVKCGRHYNNLPAQTENRVAHVRPHARNSEDTYELPDGRRMPKQCFWLNSKYLEEVLGNEASKV